MGEGGGNVLVKKVVGGIEVDGREGCDWRMSHSFLRVGVNIGGRVAVRAVGDTRLADASGARLEGWLVGCVVEEEEGSVRLMTS